MMPGLQEWIYKFEEGEGAKYIRLAFFILALLGLTAVWHIREAKNFGSIEAMDGAQVARKIADGKGFSTDFIRPLSIALLEKHRGDHNSVLRAEHPDLANAPVYPVVLAGLMKVLPFQWKPRESGFWRYQPEMIIGWFNQLLFFGALFLTFSLASRLFDRSVGYLAVVLMALTEVLWEFTTSGLSTMLLIVLLLGLLHLLAILDESGRAEPPKKGRLLGLAFAVGVMVALMALTRYSMAWLIVPAVALVAWSAVGIRGPAIGVLLATFVLVLAPWLFRNYAVSGHLFGTAGLALHEGTTKYPGNLLERSMPRNLRTELNQMEMEQYVRKLFLNGHDIVLGDLPQAAGNWVAALALGALLVPYRNPLIRRLKLFSILAVLVLLVVQALGRTAASEHSPTFNADNLLVILAPLFFIFGAAFFYTLLDQVELPVPWLRSVTVAAFVCALSLPLIFRLLPPRNNPFHYPPYFAPIIQEASGWLTPTELLMTDMPWATAWYGQRQSVWTTLDTGTDPKGDFYRINDEHKPIKGIYLTQITTNEKFLDMRKERESVWSKFYTDALVLKDVPKGFPLIVAQPAWLPDQLFLTDRIRWRE